MSVIESKSIVNDLNKIGQDYVITFDKCENEFVKTQLRDTEMYIIKRSKFCDCGTQLGLQTRAILPDVGSVEKRGVDKLAKKGWSETKVKRWLADRQKRTT